MQNNPLNKVVFIQKVAAFTKTHCLIKDLFQLAYVNNSWSDTIKNYSFHLFDKQVRAVATSFNLEFWCNRVIRCCVIWFVDVLVLSKTLVDRINMARLVCKNGSSFAMMQLVFEKVVEVGGKALFKNQLTTTDTSGQSCLMYSCHYSSSVDALRLVLENIFDAGGTDLLKGQLTAIDNAGLACLMFACCNSSCPEVMKFVMEKVVEVCGTDVFKSQLTSYDNYGRNCLMFGCSMSSSSEAMKVLFQKIVEVGDAAVLTNQLTVTDEYSGWNCITCACSNSSSPEILKLLAVLLFELGLFKKQYAKLDGDEKRNIKDKANIFDDSWVPDADSLAEVKKMLAGEFR